MIKHSPEILASEEKATTKCPKVFSPQWPKHPSSRKEIISGMGAKLSQYCCFYQSCGSTNILSLLSLWGPHGFGDKKFSFLSLLFILASFFFLSFFIFWCVCDDPPGLWRLGYYKFYMTFLKHDLQFGFYDPNQQFSWPVNAKGKLRIIPTFVNCNINESLSSKSWFFLLK